MPKGSFGLPVELVEVKFPPYKGDKLVPIGDALHVQLDHSDFTTESGLLIYGTSKARAAIAQAKVLSVGPKIDDVQEGDIVLVRQHHGSGNEGRVRKDGTMIIDKEFVVAVVERT